MYFTRKDANVLVFPFCGVRISARAGIDVDKNNVFIPSGFDMKRGLVLCLTP